MSKITEKDNVVIDRKNRPFIWSDKKGDFHFLWVWKLCLIAINNVEHKQASKFLVLWKSKYAVSIILGKHGLGIGHSFGLGD